MEIKMSDIETKSIPSFIIANKEMLRIGIEIVVVIAICYYLYY